MAVKECEEIQSWLSDYLDGTLESGRYRAVEDHLYLCPICLAQSEALEDTIKGVKSLPAVEPPAGFSQRVMAQVREESAKPGLWERLFLPFKVKIPLQAAALVLVGVLAVYVFQKNEIPQPKVSETATEQSPMTGRGDYREKDLTESPRAAAPLALSQKQARLEDRVAGARRSQDALLEEMRQSSAVPGADKKEAAGKLAGQFELVLQLQRPGEDAQVVQRKIGSLVKSLGGQRVQYTDAVEKQGPESSIQPKILWVILPAEQFERFKSELASMGTVKTGQIVPAEAALGAKGPVQLRIQLKVLPPTGSGR